MLPKLNTLEPQIGKLNRHFRLSGIERISEPKWINGEYKSSWRYIFKYLDKDQPRFFEIELDWNNKLINR
jgi:hypothetical protein